MYGPVNLFRYFISIMDVLHYGNDASSAHIRYKQPSHLIMASIIDRDITRTIAWMCAMNPNMIVFWRPDSKTPLENILLLPRATLDLNVTHLCSAAHIVDGFTKIYKGEPPKDGHFNIISLCGELSFKQTRDVLFSSTAIHVLGLEKPNGPSEINPNIFAFQSCSKEIQEVIIKYISLAV